MRPLRLAILSLAILVALCVYSGTALADSTITLQFINTGSNYAGGATTYPYNFSVNGSAPVALICDSYDNEVTIGETWKANMTSLLNGSGLFGNQLLDYKAAGLIFKSILSGALSANVGNFAIWGLFSTNAQENSFFGTSGAGAIEAEYLVLAATAPNSAFQGLVLYTPIPGTQNWGGTAQEYIGYSPVPEPTTLTLLGTGLVCLGGIVRRKLRER
jgi:hypothetical protein